MVFYIASPTYQQVISTAVKQSEQILVGTECKDDFLLLKYIKENFNTFASLEQLIVDLNALSDMDEEIIQAFDMLKMMNDEIRIIVLAANRYAGDELLTKCFQMGIYDLVVTDDFLEIRKELEYCLVIGKQYKDAIQYKDSRPEKTIVKTEVKQTVNKVMIGIAGSSGRIGVTHTSIILANYLRKRGYMTAVAEMNSSNALEAVRDAFDEKLFEDSYFNLSGIDYYPALDAVRLGNVLGKTYNFIVSDFGRFADCDRVTFNKCDVRIIIAGSKPWEINEMSSVFAISSQETLQGYHFCFNFTQQEDQEEIRKGMIYLPNVHFLPIQENPFHSYSFPAADTILEKYMPIKIAEKKSFFERMKQREKKKK